MSPAPGAGPRRVAADQAAPGRKSHGLPLRLFTPGIQHIQIQQTANFAAILQLHRQLFESRGHPLHHIKAFVAGDLHVPLLVQAPETAACQLPQQPPLPLQKASPDEPVVLHRTGNVHGQAHQALPVLLQQRPLPQNPALFGGQHLFQSHMLFPHRSLLLRTFHLNHTEMMFTKYNRPLYRTKNFNILQHIWTKDHEKGSNP